MAPVLALFFKVLKFWLALVLLLVVLPGPARLRAGSPAAPAYPVCSQPPLVSGGTSDSDGDEDNTYTLYLPLIFKGPAPPPCTVYCGLALDHDPYQPAGYRTYFAEEFDCNQLLDIWTRQGQMSAASYTPPASGYVEVKDGSLRVGVPGADVAFPYLYIVDDSATSYDVTHTGRRVDWLPGTGDFRITLRLCFKVERPGEHRIALYADGHRPAYAGPLFYVGTDYNDQEEAWRGLIVGADRGNSFVDLGDYGYPDPYPGWIIVTADFGYSTDTFTLSVDGLPRLVKPFSAFKGYPQAATRPDTLYLGSLALLENPAYWTDFEIDWLRVYVPETGPEARFGLLAATVEPSPLPTDPITRFSAALPAGPFANTPHWSEDFETSGGLVYWQLIQNPDPGHSWTEVREGWAGLRNDDQARGVPVWAIFDDMLPVNILGLEEGRESPADYLRRRGGSPVMPGRSETAPAAIYPRIDWRPDGGNVRYAWRGRQTANGYGVEISNGGHFPYFTGTLFYTLLDTTANGGQGQFIFPGCQEQYFWRLHLLPGYRVPHNGWTIITADYINGTVHLYVDGQAVGWWPESDCSLNWYLKGENATSPDVLFFGNPATGPAGGWSEIYIDWFSTFAGLPREKPL